MSEQIMGLPIMVSEGVAPSEFILHGAVNSVRWTPDGGVEELSDYQRAEVERLMPKLIIEEDHPEC